MAKVKGLVLKKTDVSQSFNLEEILGVSLRGYVALRSQMGQALIDEILERTDQGLDIDYSPLKSYDSDYVDSAEFELAGKSSSDVNMELTGNMKNQLDIIGGFGSTIVIGWRDKEQKLKAYNHNVGDTLPKRAFFGLKIDDARRVLEEQFSSDIERIKRIEAGKESQSSAEILTNAARARILRNLKSPAGVVVGDTLFRTVGDLL